MTVLDSPCSVLLSHRLFSLSQGTAEQTVVFSCKRLLGPEVFIFPLLKAKSWQDTLEKHKGYCNLGVNGCAAENLAEPLTYLISEPESCFGLRCHLCTCNNPQHQ